MGFFSVGASAATISITPGAGYAGVLFGSNFLLYGNSILTGEPVTYEQAIYNFAMTSVFYGMASYAGTGNFFDREFWFPGSTPTILPQNIPYVNKDGITAPKIQDDLIELPRVTVSADETRTVASRITSLDSELPEIGTVRLIGKTELPVQNFKLNPEWKNWGQYMIKRGWTYDEIQQTLTLGKWQNYTEGYNWLNLTNPRSLVINPITSKWLIIDNYTKEIIQLGGKGFKF